MSDNYAMLEKIPGPLMCYLKTSYEKLGEGSLEAIIQGMVGTMGSMAKPDLYLTPETNNISLQ